MCLRQSAAYVIAPQLRKHQNLAGCFQIFFRDEAEGDMSTGEQTIVIVGGVAGGMSAATRLRRNLEHARIIVVERSGYVSYANCGLPYHLGGVIPERASLLLQTPKSIKQRFGIDVRVRTEALSIDVAAKTVQVIDLDSGSKQTIQYDSLVLAPGAEPIRPPIPGIERAHVLRSVEDLDGICLALGRAHSGANAVVLGGGFVGVEVAENLHARGLKVSLVERENQLLTPLDYELAQLVHKEIKGQGVALYLGSAAVSIEDDAVVLADGQRVDADLVIAAVGVRPDTTLARDAGLEINSRGGIIVDDQMRTSRPDIYAVGDAATKLDAVSGEPTLVPLAQSANRHGRLVADVIAGRDVRAQPVLGTAVVEVFGLTVASTGWNERRLSAAQVPCQAIHTHPFNHATYYPGAEQMSLKLLFDPDDGRILGAQAVGRTGVDKRIDVIATAMRAGLSASDLADLELAYAPQFGAAKDPVNMLGFIADNVMAGAIKLVQWYEIEDGTLPEEYVLLDVRSAREFAAGAIAGAINIPVDELRSSLGTIAQKPIVVYCQSGVRANVAARLLKHHGFEVYLLDGSYETWQAAHAEASEQLQVYIT